MARLFLNPLSDIALVIEGGKLKQIHGRLPAGPINRTRLDLVDNARWRRHTWDTVPW